MLSRRREGASGGLAPQMCNKKHYKSVEFLSIFGMSSPPAQTQSRPAEINSPLLKTFSGRFCMDVYEGRKKQPAVNQKGTNIEIKSKWVPVFTFSFPEGGSPPCPPHQQGRIKRTRGPGQNRHREAP